MFDLYEMHHDGMNHLDGSSNIPSDEAIDQHSNLEITPTNSGSDSSGWTPMPNQR